MQRREITIGDIAEGLGLHQILLRFLNDSNRVDNAPTWIATAMQVYCSPEGPQPTEDDRKNMQMVNFYFLHTCSTMGCFDEGVLFLRKVVSANELDI